MKNRDDLIKFLLTFFFIGCEYLYITLQTDNWSNSALFLWQAFGFFSIVCALSMAGILIKDLTNNE